MHINYPLNSDLIHHFLFDQLYLNTLLSGDYVDINICPIFNSNIHVFHSALAMFYAPSDHSGVRGMHQQQICVMPSWQKSHARYDCMLIEKDPTLPGFWGLHTVQVCLFFSFKHNQIIYPCALVQWFVPIGNYPCKKTCMWMVELEFNHNGQHVTVIVHLVGAHLLPIYGSAFIPHELHFSEMLHAFHTYYVNKYTDHHKHETAY